jgi:hypothetical protein
MSDQDWFSTSSPRPDNGTRKAHEAAPLGTVAQVAIVLAASFGMALVVLVALAMLHNP